MKSKLLPVVVCFIAILSACNKSEKSAPAVDSASVDKESPNPAAASGEAVELTAKWTVGNKYTYRFDLTQNMKLHFPGMPQPIQQDVTLAQTYSTTVLSERPNQGRELEFQFDALELDAQMMGVTMSFDSKADTESDKTNPFATPLRKVVGSKLKVLTGGDGKLESIENYDEWQNEILAGAAPPTQMMIRSMYSRDLLKQFVETSQGLPGKPVRVGESWPHQVSVATDQMGTLNIQMKLKLKGFEQYENRRCAVIESTGTIKSSGGTMGPMGKTTIEDGKLTGTSWFDPELGATVGVDTDQKMQLQIESPATAPGGPKSFKGEVSQKVVSKLVALKTAK